MRIKNSSLTFFFMALLLTSLACNVFIGGPDYPAQTVPASTEEVQNMQTQIVQSLATSAETGIVTIQVTESQLTSLVALKLQQQANPPFTDPQVLLRDGQVQLYGKVTRGSFTANISIKANVGIDETTGMPKVEIASVDLGPIPAPEGLNDAISAMIEEAFTGSMGPVATGFRLETITIADGVMTMTGRTK